MLRITQQSSTDAAKDYYTSGSDYYREGQELIGTWGGKAAEQLGLKGTVEKREFDAMCDNLHPQSGEQLTPRTKTDRTVGYDFTWSVPKSVSVLYGLTREEGLLDAFREAVDATMKDMEEEMKTRVRQSGQNAERVTGNAAWASFYHFTSRPVNGLPDPQMHAHCFVFNTTYDQDEGRFKAGFFRDLKRDAPYFQSAFRVRLANALQERGYGIERSRDDFEIAGVPKEITRRFSRRTALIEDIAEARGITDPKLKSALGATTREHKDKTLTWDQLRDEWKSRLTDAENSAMNETAHPAKCGKAVIGKERDALEHAIDHLFERKSVVTDRQILTQAMKHGLGEISVEELKTALARTPLIARDLCGQRMITTQETLEGERKIIAFAQEGRGSCAPLVGHDRPLSRDWLADGQARAVRHLWESPDRIMMIRGAAGAGKTTLLQETVEGIESQGMPVILLAPSAEASRGVLRAEGFTNADTVAKFLADQDFQSKARGGVILVDEASLLGVRTMAKLFDRAEALDARVILVGDTRQHSAVEAGEAFRLLQEHAALPVVEVSDIRRQKGEYKQAVQALSDGRVLEGFDALDRLGWIESLPVGKREERVAEEYVQSSSETKGKGKYKEVLVISPTHREGQRVSEVIRERLKHEGKLGEERVFGNWIATNMTEAERKDSRNYSPGEMLQFHKSAPKIRAGDRIVVQEGGMLPVSYADRFQAYRPGELRIAIGDKLRVTANGKALDGHRLNNGSMIHVEGFTAKGDIEITGGHVISREFGHFTHGYVVTSYASQGRTVDRVIVVQSEDSFPASSPEQFYVSASRAREKVSIFTGDKAELRDAIVKSYPRLSASDLVRPREHVSARSRKQLAFTRRSANFDEINLQRATQGIYTPTVQQDVNYE